MERYSKRYRASWDEQKGFIWKEGTVVVANTPEERDQLIHAALQIGVQVEELDYQGEHLAVELTAEGLRNFEEALENPKATEKEIQDKLVFAKFLARISG